MSDHELAANVAPSQSRADRTASSRSAAPGVTNKSVAMIVAPLAAMLVQMTISRTREYAADRRGAEICGNPLWLASALRKIAGRAGRIVNEDAERNPATAHMFIINPLSGQRMDNLFSTHPATENRIAALEAMAEEFAVRPSPASRPGPWGRGGATSGGPWS